MNAVQSAPWSAVGHAQNDRIFPSAVGKSSDLVLEQLQADASAVALDLSVNQVKHLAKAGGVSPSQASRWHTHGRGNPVFDITTMIYRLTQMRQNPGVLIAHAQATLHHSLMPINDAELVERFFTLTEKECEAEGGENKTQAMFARTGDLEELERATIREAGIQTELAAVCRELRRRRIDPRTFGR